VISKRNTNECYGEHDLTGKRIVLVGAGSAQFGVGTVADILMSEVLSGGTIVLHDINPKSLELVRQACQIAIDETKLDFSLEATISRPEAFEGADFVIISIEIGDRFKLWEQDYEIPRKYGNKQVFGENGGPGGLFHSLRIIPPIIEICKDVERICPNAWVINFSNPMSRICLAIKRKFENKVKAVGLCHEIAFAEDYLPGMLNTPFSNLQIKAGGLNHFGILLEVKYKDTGRDAYPDISQKARTYFDTVRASDEISHATADKSFSLVTEILRIYNYLPYTHDSHFGEYIQWASECADQKYIREFYEIYKLFCLEQPNQLKSIVEEKQPTSMWLTPSGERAIPIIEGIVTDSKHHELSVNLPNEGIIDNLPRDLVVECPATVDKNGVQGVKLGEIPSGLAGLMRIQATVQDLTVQAALTGSKKKALEALLADPTVDSLSAAEKMLNEILQLQGEYLKLK
jgi:alpha-galactosidase